MDKALKVDDAIELQAGTIASPSLPDLDISGLEEMQNPEISPEIQDLEGLEKRSFPPVFRSHPLPLMPYPCPIPRSSKSPVRS